MKHHYHEKALALLASDIAACILSFAIVLAVRYGPMQLSYHYTHFFSNFLIMTLNACVVLFILDLYSTHKMPEAFLRQMLHMGAGLMISALVSILMLFLIRDILPRPVFVLFYGTAFLLIYAARRMLFRWTTAEINWQAILVGDAAQASKAYKLSLDKKYLHVSIAGYITDSSNRDAIAEPKYLGSSADLLDVVDVLRPDQLIIASRRLDEKLQKALFKCMKRKIKVIDYRFFVEQIAEKVPIDNLQDNWFFEQLGNVDKRYFWYAKRSVDLILSFLGVLITLIILPLVSLLIKIDSAGPVFYSQLRVGRDGKVFRVWKLRTMVKDAESSQVFWTNENDARITRIGKWIRKMRVDELPQFFNILKGEMSLIGPRPEAVSLVEMYRKEIPYYDERHMVTPGITGWAQINYRYGNSIEDAREKLKYDYYYIKNRSMLLDLIILLRTTRIVLTGKGAI